MSNKPKNTIELPASKENRFAQGEHLKNPMPAINAQTAIQASASGNARSNFRYQSSLTRWTVPRKKKLSQYSNVPTEVIMNSQPTTIVAAFVLGGSRHDRRVLAMSPQLGLTTTWGPSVSPRCSAAA